MDVTKYILAIFLVFHSVLYNTNFKAFMNSTIFSHQS